MTASTFTVLASVYTANAGWLVAVRDADGDALALSEQSCGAVDTACPAPTTREAAARWLRALAASRFGGTTECTLGRLTPAQVGYAKEARMRVGVTVAHAVSLEQLALFVANAYQHINGGPECAESDFLYQTMERSAGAAELRYFDAVKRFETTHPLIDIYWNTLAPHA